MDVDEMPNGKSAIVPALAAEVSKEEFLVLLAEVLQKAEVSWVTTDARSFEWDEINRDKPKFVESLRSLKFSKAFVGTFYADTKKMEYSTFRVR